MLGLLGIKQGMTRVFREDGSSVPVSVVSFEDNVVTFVGDSASKHPKKQKRVQIGSIVAKSTRVNKAYAGHFAKNSLAPNRFVKEFALSGDELDASGLKVGSVISLETFEEGQYVDVSGKTKGKGFAGTIKAHHFRGQDKTHGNSRSHRVPGSIGQRQTPGRVFKGKKMCKRLGNEARTVQCLRIEKIDLTNRAFLIKGAIPGPVGSFVVVKPSVKAKNTKKAD